MRKQMGVYHDVKLMTIGGVTSSVDAVKAMAMDADGGKMASAIETAMRYRTYFSCQIR